jgi:hypothetical protein
MQGATDTSSRWSSQSPLGFNAGDTNLNRYVGNSPTNNADPSGLVEESDTPRVVPFFDQPVGSHLGANYHPVRRLVDS